MSICAQAPLYRQREFHQSPLWRILVDHGEEFLRTYDSRYEETHGPLPLQSARVMEKLLRCGDPRYGLTLLYPQGVGVRLATFGGRLRPSTDWVQHIPRARQHQVTYAGHFANALGHLNPKQESQVEESAEKPKSGKWVKWRTLVLRSRRPNVLYPGWEALWQTLTIDLQ